MTKLFLDIGRALVGHQKHRGIRVSQVMGISNPELGTGANSFH